MSKCAATQVAVRRLSQTMKMDDSERREWMKQTDDATKDAWGLAKGLLKDAVPDIIDARLSKQLESANSEVQRAVQLLAGELEPNRREQLHATIKLLDEQRKEIVNAQGIVSKAREVNGKIAAVAGLEAKGSKETVNSLENMHEFMVGMLGNETVQKALNIGAGYGKVLSLGETILDSAYDITVDVVSIKRIGALNNNQEQYLVAIRKLSDHLQSVVLQLNRAEQ
jgi:hypothetical protein